MIRSRRALVPTHIVVSIRRKICGWPSTKYRCPSFWEPFLPFWRTWQKEKERRAS